jgi:hypothetical protein
MTTFIEDLQISNWRFEASSTWAMAYISFGSIIDAGRPEFSMMTSLLSSCSSSSDGMPS